MATPINMHLYRLLVKQGAEPAEAEQAARIDASDLATKGDLAEVRTDLASLKVDVGGLKWMFGVTWALLLIILGAVLQVLLKLPAVRP